MQFWEATDNYIASDMIPPEASKGEKKEALNVLKEAQRRSIYI